MNGFLIDTNHLRPALERVSAVRELMYRARRKGSRLGTCVPVLCELEAGIQQTKRLKDYRRNLQSLTKHLLRIWPIGRDLASIYGEVYLELKAKGRALSQVDMMLAAMARQRKLILLTTDRDFAALPDVRTENWLS